MEPLPKRARFDDDVEIEMDTVLPHILPFGNAAELPRDPYWPGDRCSIPDGPASYDAIAAGDWVSNMMQQASSDHRPFIDTFVENMERGTQWEHPCQWIW